MNNWLTSDLHFGHVNIIEYTNRPYTSVEQMNNDLVARWNSLVRPEDTVWILGDLAMGKKQESLRWVAILNGKKILVPGNHDAMFGKQGTKYLEAFQMYNDVGVSTYHVDDLIYLDLTSACRVLVSHFPYTGESVEGHEDRYSEHRPLDRGEKLVHGHTHGVWRKRGNMVDVGVDAWGGYPITFEEVATAFGIDGDLEPLEWK